MEILTLDERIKSSLALGESLFREFKSCFEGSSGDKQLRDPKILSKEISETLVAFANADGGELFIGVEDNSLVTGVSYNESTIDKLLNAFIDGVHQDTPIHGTVSRIMTIEDKKILYFALEKSSVGTHQTSDGRQCHIG